MNVNNQNTDMQHFLTFLRFIDIDTDIVGVKKQWNTTHNMDYELFLQDFGLSVYSASFSCLWWWKKSDVEPQFVVCLFVLCTDNCECQLWLLIMSIILRNWNYVIIIFNNTCQIPAHTKNSKKVFGTVEKLALALWKSLIDCLFVV